MPKAPAVSTVVFDVDYSDLCAQCGAATGFSMQDGGIICANRHKIEPQQAQTQASAPTAEQPALETSGAFRSGSRPRPQQRPQQQPATVGIDLSPKAETAAVAVVPVQVSQVATVEGGDLEITLRIPDRHADAVKAEAEIQKQTVTEYLQFWINEALDNFWGR